MSEKIEQLLKGKQISYIKGDDQLVQFVGDGIGYGYFCDELTTQLIDRMYISFNSMQITSLELYVETMPGAIINDYAARRNIKIISVTELEQAVSQLQNLNFETESHDKMYYTDNAEESSFKQKDDKSVQYNDDVKLTDSTSKEEEIASTDSKRVMTEEEIKAEVKKMLLEKRAAYRKKRAKQSMYITVCSLLVMLFLQGLESIEDNTEKINRDSAFMEMPIVEDYTFDPTDILPKSTDYSSGEMESLYNLQLGSGKDYLINQKSNPFPKYATYDDEYEIEVEDDIEPGIYTIKVEGDVMVSIDSELDLNIENNGLNNYNIPLVQGTTINVSPYNEVVDYQLQLIAQDQLTMYADGLSGLFIYGLTYFDSNLDIDLQENYVYYSYPYNGENTETVKIEDYGNDTYDIAGIPGSYIYVNSQDY